MVPEGETPTTGSIFITVNSEVVEIVTTGLPSASVLNDRIYAALDAEFDVAEDDTSWVIYGAGSPNNIQRIGFRSTDDAITTSRLSLETWSGFLTLPPCFD
jgi:hypothetical protein